MCIDVDYKVLRAGRKNRKMMYDENRSTYCLIVGANWRLEKSTSPVAMLQEDNQDATSMSKPDVHGILL